MSIKCAICQKTFDKIIPWQHLKTHHITSAEYKTQHGSLYSDETLKKFQTRIPHNKGKKISDPVQLEKFRQSIKKRELRFQLGEIKRGAKKTPEQKQIASDKNKAYALAHPEEIKNRAAKATQTKIRNQYDFGKNMREKKHSLATKTRIRLKAKENNHKKSQKANDQILARIDHLNLALENDIANWNLDLCCKTCNTKFSFTKQYFHLSKIKSTICPQCHPRKRKSSTGEKELFLYISHLDPTAIYNYRPNYHDKEIDIYLPNLKIGFEFNGLYWHSEEVLLHNNKSPKSDFEKQKFFKDKGIRIIQIFEDEWANRKDIVKSRIENILGFTKTKIPARKCQVKEISSRESAKFCNQYHIMGNGRSNVRFGLYYLNELVAVMTFSKNNLSRKIFDWELNRFATKNNIHVVGGASKLFKAFTRKLNPDVVISYSDNRWSVGSLYQTLGFKEQNGGDPNYWYLLPNVSKRIHRFSLKKNNTDPKGLTEYQLRQNQGYSRIWDCGSAKWQWTKENRA